MEIHHRGLVHDLTHHMRSHASIFGLLTNRTSFLIFTYSDKDLVGYTAIHSIIRENVSVLFVLVSIEN